MLDRKGAALQAAPRAKLREREIRQGGEAMSYMDATNKNIVQSAR